MIADFAAYPEWADAIKSSDVLTRDGDGRPATVRFRVVGGPYEDTYVLRYQWAGEELVSWNIAEAGSVISELSGSYKLAERDDGTGVRSTEVTYELSLGITVPIPAMIRRKAEKAAEQAIVDAALSGLKTRAETIIRRGS